MILANKCFGREMQPKNHVENVCFGLGHTCREDYLEILLLASNGYGVGASKLFRGLYERAVTIAYLIKHPDKAERFGRFAAVQEHRTMQGALKTVTEEQFDEAMGPHNTVALIGERYNTVKPEFQVALCKKCGTTRTAPSWDLDVAAMVHDVGGVYENIFLMGYAIPNLHIHATLASALKDIDNQDLDGRAERKQDEGEFVLSLATAILIQVMRSQNTLFSLGLDADLDVCDQDVVDVWITS